MSLYSDLEDFLLEGTQEAFALLGYPTPNTDGDEWIIFSHSNGAEPCESYCVINVLNTLAVGRAFESTAIDTQTGLVYTQQYELTVRFQFVGSQSGELSHVFFENINKNRLVREIFQVKGISPTRKTPVRRVPQLRTVTWIDSFNVDVVFSFNHKTTQVVNWVEHVRIKDEKNDITTIPPLP